MAYVKRDWDNTGNEVTKEDFKRIEDGIESNDQEITKMKSDISDIAQEISDMKAEIEENSQQINVLNTIEEHVYTDGELLNGWTIVSRGTGAYLQKVGKQVKLQVMIKNTAKPTNNNILVIPEGFRPRRNQYIASCSQSDSGLQSGALYIIPNGMCYFSAFPANCTRNIEFHASWFTS